MELFSYTYGDGRTVKADVLPQDSTILEVIFQRDAARFQQVVAVGESAEDR